MPGDVSRSTFSKLRHYRAVRKQQGRVDLDADWNEQVDITSHRFDAEALDVVGRSGVPKDNAGFGLSVVNNVPVISAGRAYVDGILCENEQNALALTAQPDLPNVQLPATAGRYLAFLDVWERELSAVDDPSIREVALGGPDTCTRRKTVWQVKMLQADAAGGQFACGNPLPAFDGLSSTSTGTLAAQATPTQSTSNPCIIPPSAGFTGLENQLYRVEILAGGPAAAATFTWARNNASSVAAWTAQSGNDLTITAGNTVSFTGGQWIELTDDTTVLAGARGLLVRLATVRGSTLTIDPTTASVPVDIKNFPLNARVIGWNSTGAVGVAAGTWVGLENGLQVQFSNGAATYRAGDYWLIPARSGVGILWPLDASNAPLAVPPQGIAHHYARLAIVDVGLDNKTWTFIQDCRLVFPPLTELTTGSGTTDALKVQQVLLSLTGGTLVNDTSVSVTALLGGVQIVLDRPPEPVSIKPATCYVTLLLPFPLDDTQAVLWGKGLAGTVPLVLDGNVSVSGRAIEWAPSPSATQFLQGQLFQGLAHLGLFSGSVLARFMLNGNFVWLLGNPGVHLDGKVFGTPAASNASTSIGLPSGAGNASGDFEMWFALTPAAAVLNSFVLGPPSVVAGSAVSGILTLSGVAPASGQTITLSAIASDSTTPNIPGAVTLPATVVFPGSAASISFNFVTQRFTTPNIFDPVRQPAIDAPVTRTVKITATSTAGTLVATLTVTPAHPQG